MNRVQTNSTTPIASTFYGAAVDAAAREYLARRDRRTNPDGTFDSAGRWYPADGEKQPCCAAIRSPSRAYPYSYMVHCRTVAHVAAVHGVDARDLKSAARLIERATPAKIAA